MDAMNETVVETDRMAPPKGSPKHGGRAKGTPNRVTSVAREAWALAWADLSLDVAGWIREVRDGKPEDDDGPARPPDPARAAELALRMAEYHVPRLAQQQLTGAEGEPLTIVVQSLAEVTRDQGSAGAEAPGRRGADTGDD